MRVFTFVFVLVIFMHCALARSHDWKDFARHEKR